MGDCVTLYQHPISLAQARDRPWHVSISMITLPCMPVLNRADFSDAVDSYWAIVIAADALALEVSSASADTTLPGFSMLWVSVWG